MVVRVFFIFWLGLAWCESAAQIRIEVVSHPKFSLSDSSLYISGSFNGWSPGDENYKLIRKADGVYYYDLPDTLRYFEYKFTQGSWSLVEGSKDGKIIPNRVYDQRDITGPRLVEVVIEGWEQHPAYVIIVRSVPRNTPHDATIFVMGNFNNWNPVDQAYRLTKQVDGSYRGLIYSAYDQLQFKFTRGTHESVESKPGGRFLPNRTLSHRQVKNNSNVEVEIVAWSDLGSGSLTSSIFDLLLLFSFFQGVLLIITIPSIQGYNHSANRWLLFLIGFSSVILLIKVVANQPVIFRQYPKLQLLPDFIFFIYSPLFYFYLQRLLFHYRNLWSKSVRYHFIPALAQFFIYMAYLLMDDNMFTVRLSDPNSDLYLVRFVVGTVAVLFNFYYWRECLLAVNRYKNDFRNTSSYEQNLQYLNTVLFMQAVCLFAWAISILITIAGRWFGFDVINIIEFNIDTIWIVFSMITFFLGYFAIHEPDIFRVPEMAAEPVFNPITIPQLQYQEDVPDIKHQPDEVVENLDEEVNRVTAYMEEFKPYTNPKLTLIELASRLEMPPHLLSRIINSGFGKNFFDFVNSYRIEEFKRRVDDQQFRNYTLLSIAFDVGFNSKTAFNRSFKKITSKTPSEYFKVSEPLS